jgi:hypothetical protein
MAGLGLQAVKKLIRFAGIVAGIGAAVWLMKDRFLQIPEHGDGEISPFRVPATDGNGAQPSSTLVTPATTEPAEATGGNGDTDDLTEIKGVGPVYAQRLIDFGITSFAALAAADAAEAAEHLNLTTEQVQDWIEQATDRA